MVDVAHYRHDRRTSHAAGVGGVGRCADLLGFRARLHRWRGSRGSGLFRLEAKLLGHLGGVGVTYDFVDSGEDTNTDQVTNDLIGRNVQ